MPKDEILDVLILQKLVLELASILETRGLFHEVGEIIDWPRMLENWGWMDIDTAAKALITLSLVIIVSVYRGMVLIVAVAIVIMVDHLNTQDRPCISMLWW